jgi:ribosome modulation factor
MARTKKQPPKNRPSIHAEGESAREHGHPLSSCPYGVSDWQREVWIAGWGYADVKARELTP